MKISANVRWFPTKKVRDSRCFCKYFLSYLPSLRCNLTLVIYFFYSSVEPKKNSAHNGCNDKSCLAIWKVYVSVSPFSVTSVGMDNLRLPSS